MGAFFPLFFFLALVGIFSAIKLLLWYQNKEQTDARELDLAVLAAEHDLRFRTAVEGFATMLRKNYFGLSFSNIEIKNVISERQPNNIVHLFDYSHQENGKSKELTPYSAILIEFHNQIVPTCKISQKESIDWKGYSYIDENLVPHWVPSKLTVIAHDDQQKATCQFLNDNPAIRDLISQPSFHKAYFRGRRMVVYYDGMYGASETGFNWMLRRANDLRGIKGTASKAVDEDVEINLLKQSQRPG